MEYNFLASKQASKRIIAKFGVAASGRRFSYTYNANVNAV